MADIEKYSDEVLDKLSERVTQNHITSMALFRAMNKLSSFVVDLEDEMTTVVTEDGKAVSSTDMVIGIRAYYGTKDITRECTVTTENVPDGVTLTPDPDDKSKVALHIDANTPLSNTTRLDIIVTHVPYGIRKSTFILNAINGTIDTPIYQLAPSLSAFSFGRNEDDTLTPDSIRVAFKVKKSVKGVSRIVNIPSGLKVVAKVDAEPSYTDTGIDHFDFPSGGLNLHVALYEGETLLDIETIPAICDGLRGEKGEDGASIVDVNNYYSWGTSGKIAPTGSYSKGEVPAHIDGFDYLWNYEETINDKGIVVSTSKKSCIGYFPQDGANGVGIQSVDEYYQRSNSVLRKPAVPVLSADKKTIDNLNGWSSDVITTDNDNRYLWNVEIVTFTDGTMQVGKAHTAGVQGIKGIDGLTPTINPATKEWEIGGVSTGVKAEGEKGATPQRGLDYEDTKNVVMFGRSSQSTSTSESVAPTDLDTRFAPSGWSTKQPLPVSEYPHIWQRASVYKYNYAQKQYVVDASTVSYTRISGNTPQKGVDYFDGENGKTWKPTVDADGNLSWSIDNTTTTPTGRNIKGVKGDSLRFTWIGTKLYIAIGNGGYDAGTDLKGAGLTVNPNNKTITDENGNSITVPTVTKSGNTITINGESITPLTSHQSLAGYAKITDIPDISGKADKTELPTITKNGEQITINGSWTIPTQTGLESGLSGKQNTISDLGTIRAGAALGATALQTHQSLDGCMKTTHPANSITEALKTSWSGKANPSDIPKTLGDLSDGGNVVKKDNDGNVGIAGEVRLKDLYFDGTEGGLIRFNSDIKLSTNKGTTSALIGEIVASEGAVYLNTLYVGGESVATQDWVNEQGFLKSVGSYLPLTGGTITGSTMNPLRIRSTLTTTKACYTSMYSSDGYRTDVGGYDGFSFLNRCVVSTGARLGEIRINNDSSLQYVVGNSTVYDILHSGNIGSQSVNYANSAASAANSTYANSAGNSNSLAPYGFGYSNLTFAQTAGDVKGKTDWASYIICNHGDGNTYFNQIIRMPFWGSPEYGRAEADGVEKWYNFITSENVSSYAIQFAYDTNLGASSPADVAKTYFDSAHTNCGAKLYYNSLGAEYSLLFTPNTVNYAYGTILKWGYHDTYIRILRRAGGEWQSGDWEKISAGYADSAGYAGNAGSLSSYSESAFLRYRGLTSVDGEGTLWSQIGIKQYNAALPDGLTGVYNWGQTISFASSSGRLDIYASHLASDDSGLYYRSGWVDDKRTWRALIDSRTIGSYALPLSGGVLTGHLNVAYIKGGGTTSSVVSINDTTTYSSWNSVLNCLTPNSQAGGRPHIIVGVRQAAKNAAYIGFYYAGSGSNDNRLMLGLHSVDDQFCLTGGGNVGIGTTAPSYKLHVNGHIRSEHDIYAGGSLTIAGSATIVGGITCNNGETVIHTGNISSYAVTSVPSIGFGTDVQNGQLPMGAVQLGNPITDISASGHTLTKTHTYITLSKKNVTDALGYTPLNGGSYLALSGGTMTGKLLINKAEDALTVRSSNNQYNAIRFENSSGDDRATIQIFHSAWPHCSEQLNFQHTDGKITFGLWTSPAMTIDIDKVGIGTGTPLEALHVEGTVRIQNLNLGIARSGSLNKDATLIVKSQSNGGNTGFCVGGSAPYSWANDANFLYVAGVAYASQHSNVSDMTQKIVLKQLEVKFDDILNAPIFLYRLKENPQMQPMMGTSAQYWVDKAEGSVLGQYGGYTMPYGNLALAACVSVAKRVKTIEEKIAELQEELEKLKTA